MIVRSIRWRLVMGSVLLTLLTVSAVGVVALLLMQRYMVQQERAYLTANAQAIAQQAASFMTPVQISPPLQQLAQTAAFLGDVAVRIVDDTQMPLADSTVAIPYTDTVGLAAPPIYFRIAASPPAQNYTLMAPIPGELRMAIHELRLETRGMISSTMPMITQDANVIVVQKSPSIWGDRLTFEAEAVPISTTQSLADELPSAYTGAHWVSSEVVQGEIVPSGEDLSRATAVVGQTSFDKVVVTDHWQMETGLTGEKVWAQETRTANTMVPLSFLQSTGFQSTGVVTAPIQMGGTVVGFVELARSSDLVNEPLGAIRRALAIAAGASALLAIAVGLVMSRTLTAPIQNLAYAAAAMSSGDLTARAPVVGKDELASLAHQFNQMADALHRSFAELAAERDTLRRFVADASHELRTPITALRTFNELLQGPALEDRNVQVEFLAESHAQITRLEWITRNLLDLSRWDGGMATLVMAEVEVGELVATAASPFRAMAQERQIDFNVLVPQTSIVASVDEQWLGMAVGNLLDNALKFTSGNDNDNDMAMAMARWRWG